MKIIGIMVLYMTLISLLIIGFDLLLGFQLGEAIKVTVIPYTFTTAIEKFVLGLFPIVIIGQLIYLFVQKKKQRTQ